MSFLSRSIAIVGLSWLTGTAAIVPLVLTPPAQAQTIPNLPEKERWLTHLRSELMPFWMTPAALGNPIGKFPTVRCNNGSAVNYSSPCPEVAGNGYLLENRNYVVAMSRQVYGYCTAFHLTGDPQYLQYAKAGVDYLRRNAFDRTNGGTHVYFDNRNQTWGPAPGLRNTQELAYALLGMSFYYYLTRDQAVLADIQTGKDHIFRRYYNPGLNMLQWQLQDGNGNRALDKQFTGQIDQLSYMFLVMPSFPEGNTKNAWRYDMERIVNAMQRDFYSSRDNLFFLRANNANDKNIQVSGTDFGHTAKGFWTTRLAGRMLGKQSWVDFTNRNAPRMLERAYLSNQGAWATGVKPGGAIDGEKSWWIHAELDQLSSVLAMTDRNQGRYLPQTYNYWLNVFTDRSKGEVWTNIAAGSNQPIGLPKAWAWKNAYHSTEHALFAYVTTAQIKGQPVRLHYAFQSRPADSAIYPHVFRGTIQSIQTKPNPNGGTIYTVDYTGLRF
jgi:mannose/cellobiose epimerase-like protein (N-acyl-D-glucosamine 2-epimerase family)